MTDEDRARRDETQRMVRERIAYHEAKARGEDRAARPQAGRLRVRQPVPAAACSSRRRTLISSRSLAAYSKRSSRPRRTSLPRAGDQALDLGRGHGLNLAPALPAATWHVRRLQGQEVGDIGDALVDGLGYDAVLLVVGKLEVRRRFVSSIAP